MKSTHPILEMMQRFGFGLLVLSINISSAAGQSLGCTEFGPFALTTALGQRTPQTCIDVPFDDGSGTVVMQNRCYYTYIPKNAVCQEKFETNESPTPVVFDMHGLTSCPLYSAAYTGWREQADKDCFVVVWPSGNVGLPGTFGGCFNLPGNMRSETYGNNITTAPCCCQNFLDAESAFNDPKPDDPLFLRMAIDKVIEDVGADVANNVSIDRSRVYMAGHSNGCITSLAMAALYSDAIAAVCCHAGAVVTPFDPATYNSPVPIMTVHGLLDDTIAFDGVRAIPPFLFPGQQRGFWPVLDTLDYLSDANGCQDADTLDIEGDTTVPDDNVAATLYRKTNCDKGADVQLLAIKEAGHVPYSGSSDLGDDVVSTAIDTTALAWEFCSSHTKSQPPEPLVSSSPPEEPEMLPEEIDEPEPEPAPEEEETSAVEEIFLPEDEFAASVAAATDELNEESSGSILRVHDDGFGTLLLASLAVLVALATIP